MNWNMGRKKMPATVEGLWPGVAGVAADADLHCLPCARKVYGKAQVQIVIDGRMDELDPAYPTDGEHNPIHAVLTSEEFEVDQCCGDCFRPLDIVVY